MKKTTLQCGTERSLRAFFTTLVIAATPLSLAPQVPGAAAKHLTLQDADRLLKTQGDKKEQAAPAKAVNLYAVPDMPALAFLDGSSATISRPITPKDLAASLANGRDEKGRVKQGIAIEVSPYILIPGFADQVKKSPRSPLNWLLSRSLLSIATTQVAVDTLSTDLAWGTRITLIDDGNPMRDSAYRAEVSEIYAACLPKGPPEDSPRIGAPEAELRAFDAVLKSRNTEVISCMDRDGTALAKQYASKNWNARRFVIAYGGGNRLPESELKNNRRLGDRFWAVYSHPLGTSAQLVGYADWRHRFAQDTMKEFRAVNYGGRLNIGSQSVNGFAELLGENRTDPPVGVAKSVRKWSAGIEFQAAEGLWISTGFGKRAEDLLKPDRVVLVANIQWGISKAPFLVP